MVAKLRTSTHNLKIEMGRRTGTPRAERTCICGDVEDESHFLTKCGLYTDIRQKFNVSPMYKLEKLLDDHAYVEYYDELFKRRKEAMM